MDSRKQTAELVGECNFCGSLTVESLELAWQAKSIRCSNCGIAMVVRADTLAKLQRQALEAQVTLNRLL
jgi:transcription elongation factor Elf1